MSGTPVLVNDVEIELTQAGYGGNDIKYVDFGSRTEVFVTAHDTDDQLMITVDGRVEGEARWLDIELDFHNAQLLANAINEAMERKTHATTYLRSSVG